MGMRMTMDEGIGILEDVDVGECSDEGVVGG